jgi:aspartate aminotransferase
MQNSNDVYLAVCGAGRSLGYVCAPSLFQQVVTKCIDAKVNIDAYKKNRDLLYNSLVEYGFDCVKPDGAFYLFVKSKSGDAFDLYERAKKHEILLVPCDDFGVKGYVRIAYCVDKQRIINSLPAFKKLANELL